MTSQERTAALKVIAEVKDASFTEEELRGLAMLSDKCVGSLHALASKSPADAIIQAKAAADAALAGHAHGLNAMDEAEKAKAAKKAADAAAKAKDEGKDDEKDGEKKRAAALKAAEEAGFKTAEEHERAIFYEKNPEIKALVERQRAADAARKDELVAALKGGPLDEAALKAKSIEDLETLARFARVEAVDFSGRGVPRAAAEADVFANPPNPYAEALKRRAAK